MRIKFPIFTGDQKTETLLEENMSLLQQSEQFFELVNDGVMIRTFEGKINSWNRGAAELYGWRREEAIGRISHDLLQTQFPKPLEEIESELLRNGFWEGNLVHTTRDGGRVVVRSRWAWDPSKTSGAVFEINAPSLQSEIGRTSEDTGSAKSTGPLAQTRPRFGTGDRLATVVDFIIGGGAFLWALAFAYFSYLYVFAVKRTFAHPTGILIYEVVPAVAAILLLVALRWRRSYRINLALAIVSTTIAVYAVEFALTWIPRPSGPAVTLWADDYFTARQEKQIARWARRSGIAYDFRRKFEVISDFRKKGIDAVPAIIPMGLLGSQADGSAQSKLTVNGREFLPVSGISSKLTVLCNETGSYATYESDSHGFHNPRTIWQSNVNIAGVGDSFTIGGCVPSDKNFVALIRKQYPETLNLGMLGEGPLIELAALREYLSVVRPKIVLWFFYEENDFLDLQKESKSALLKSYLQDDFSQGLFYRQGDIDRTLAAYVERAFKAEESQRTASVRLGDAVTNFLTLTNLRQKAGLVYGKAVDANKTGEFGEYNEAQLNLFRQILFRAKNAVHGWGGQLYFVYLPARDRYANKENYHRESILSIVRDIDIPVIDLSVRFLAQEDPLSLFPYGRFGHYNEKGHELVAEAVLSALNSKNLQ